MFKTARFYLRAAELLARGRKVTPAVISSDYNRLSNGYDEYFSSYMKKHSLEMVRQLGIREPDILLDLACGTGAITLEAASLALKGKVVAVDNSAGMLERAREKADSLGLKNIKFVQGDILEEIKKFPDGSFDYVTCGWAIGYVDHAELFNEIRRVLKTGGSFGVIENRQNTLREIRITSINVAKELPSKMNRIMDLPLRLPRGAGHLGRLFRSAGMADLRSWEGKEEFVFDSGEKALEWVLHTGASAGFDTIMAPETKAECDRLFIKFIERDFLKDSKLPVAHRYVAGIARKNEPIKRYVGAEKYLRLLGMLKAPEVSKFPVSVLLRLPALYKDDKLTKMGKCTVVNSFMPPFPGEAFDRLVSSVERLIRKEVVPLSCYIAVTNKCRYNCWHCSKAFRKETELSLPELKSLVHQLIDLGVSIIGFTGGEPLLRPDLEEAIREIGTKASTILFTTGDGLTLERAASLKESGLFGVAISLDSPHSDIHNQLRGREDAFEIALKAVGVSLKSGFYTMLQVVARKDLVNAGMLEYVEFARQLGVHEIRVIEPMPTGNLVNMKECLLTPQERQSLKDLHIEINRRKDYPTMACFAYIEDESLYGCGAGLQHLYVDAQGNVCPCDFTPLSFGNIKEERLESAWKRLREAFKRPRSRCFVLENASGIRESFDGKFPLDKEESIKICRKCRDDKLPRYYRLLGWV